MKDKSIRQPWPQSARVTVWVLSVIVAASAVVNIVAITQWYGPYQKWPDYSTLHFPLEAPKEKDVPIIMPDLDDPALEDIPDLHKIDFEYPALEPTT